MKILGLETSCDETAIAVLETNGVDFSLPINIISSQVAKHAPFGGVVPELAAREHAAALPALFKAAAIDPAAIDLIAVTAGPGLLPALRLGVTAAAALAWSWQKPLCGVSHVVGHFYSVWLSGPAPVLPALGLIVSGGHTELVLLRSPGDFVVLGGTRDDAAGEAFDKVAKLLGLGYPGGPAVSALAESGRADAIAFPRPMVDSPNFDFSFSGLKTAVAVYLEAHPDANSADVAASFQAAVVDSLLGKTLAAVERYVPKSVILAGGVSANIALRDRLTAALHADAPQTTFYVPPLALTGDNAAMIAATGYFAAQAGHYADPLTLHPDPNLGFVL